MSALAFISEPARSEPTSPCAKTPSHGLEHHVIRFNTERTDWPYRHNQRVSFLNPSQFSVQVVEFDPEEELCRSPTYDLTTACSAPPTKPTIHKRPHRTWWGSSWSYPAFTDRLTLSAIGLKRCLLSKLMGDIRSIPEWRLSGLYQASIQ